jgi:hypothetical protein
MATCFFLAIVSFRSGLVYHGSPLAEGDGRPGSAWFGLTHLNPLAHLGYYDQSMSGCGP